MSTRYLIRNGEVFDGSGSAPATLDVRIAGSTIAQMSRGLNAPHETVIDASGLLVVPGLIDMHVHAFTGFGQFGVSPEEIGLRTGVTTMLDAGTTGALTYTAMKQLIIDRAPEDIFALLNISVIGCTQGHPKVMPYMGELSDIRYAHAPAAVECLRKHGSPLIGMKARLTKGLANNSRKNEEAGFHGALEAARQTGTFLMVHHVNSAIPVDEFLGAMRRGDIMTHLYHPHGHSPFAVKSRRPLAALLEGRERGVVFDVGHGAARSRGRSPSLHARNTASGPT